MQFPRLDFYLQQCEKHLDSTGARNTEVENYFVQFLLTRIVAEFETRIALLVEMRCARSRDKHLRNFSKRAAKDAAKRFKIGDLKGTLNRFGDDYMNNFHAAVDSTAAHVAWDNIYSNRQSVAHGSGTQMSLGDLLKNYAESVNVLDSLVAALQLKPREIKALK